MDNYLIKLINNYPTKKGLARTKEQVHFFIKFEGKKYPISFFDENFLEVETSIVPKLRGLVDIYKLDKFFAQGLLVMMEAMSISPSMNIKGILIQRKRNPPITYCKVCVKAERT